MSNPVKRHKDARGAPLAEMDQQFAEIAVARGLITDAEVSEALSEHQPRRATSGHCSTLPQLLLDRGSMSLHQIESVLAEVLKLSGDAERCP